MTDEHSAKPIVGHGRVPIAPESAVRTIGSMKESERHRTRGARASASRKGRARA